MFPGQQIAGLELQRKRLQRHRLVMIQKLAAD
jgi:hypothetical protein